jgi:hypothetical protein
MDGVLPTSSYTPEQAVLLGAVVREPTLLGVDSLKDAARLLDVKRSATKPQLILRLLATFGLSAPSPAPPAVLCAVQREKRMFESPPRAIERAKRLHRLSAAMRNAAPSGRLRGAGALVCSPLSAFTLHKHLEAMFATEDAYVRACLVLDGGHPTALDGGALDDGHPTARACGPSVTIPADFWGDDV